MDILGFQRMADIIMSSTELDGDSKRRAVAIMWLAIETDDIQNPAQYEACKKEHAKLKASVYDGPPAGFPAFMNSPEGEAFLHSPDGLRWQMLDGLILAWEGRRRGSIEEFCELLWSDD